MQIFKITTEDSKPVLEKISGGILLILPTENDNLNNFNIPEVKDDSIYIIEAAPDTSNPLNYNGVGIALKIYFQTISESINKIRIILFGFEDKQSFFQFCNYSNILKCPGIEYVEIGNENLEEILEIEVKELNVVEIKQSLLNIGIKPPTSYKSHHSIANEWSILRWAKALQIKSDSLEKIREEVDSSLYYKYLKSIYPIKKGENIKNGKLKNSGKILFIDDEVEKGWGVIFKEICGVELTVYGSEFKDWITEKIIRESFNRAKEFDVVILDLRLHDDDFDENDPKNLTGYKILKKIKEHNNGIQVIIFSATNKIWNLQALESAGADGFIIKESPEMSVDPDFTSISIENIYKTIDECLDYAFVKCFYEKYVMLKENLERKKRNKELPKEFVDEYLKWLVFGINNLLKYKSNEGHVLTFVMFFSVLENISTRLISVDNPEATNGGMFKFKFRRNNNYLISFDWNRNSKNYTKTTNDLVSNRSINWNQKILNTLDVLGCDLPNIGDLIQKRNDIIHSNSTTGNVININKIELEKLFKIITENIENIE